MMNCGVEFDAEIANGDEDIAPIRVQFEGEYVDPWTDADGEVNPESFDKGRCSWHIVPFSLLRPIVPGVQLFIDYDGTTYQFDVVATFCVDTEGLENGDIVVVSRCSGEVESTPDCDCPRCQGVGSGDYADPEGDDSGIEVEERPDFQFPEGVDVN